MREILFRGKRGDNGEWVYWTAYGKFTKTQYGKLINQGKGFTDWAYEILTDPDTEGQYTGLTDKNGKRIFEGDIIRLEDGLIEMVGEVVFCEACFYIFDGDTHEVLWYESECFEIIGNIHDNPELLKEV